jgi:hypothetical protein
MTFTVPLARQDAVSERKPGTGTVDLALVALFLIGISLGVSIPITPTVPLTCAPSGFAGLLLLWRRRNDIEPVHLAGLLAVLGLYAASIVCASDYSFLIKRFTGLLQLTYSLIIGYALFLTLVRIERRRLAGLLLAFCLCIIGGCLLENYGGLRGISNAVREKIYDSAFIYGADLRDEILYGRIRPKLFTSEPSAVTFAFTQFCSMWLVISPSRYKLLLYIALVVLGLVMLPGPTLVLMLLLIVPFLLFLAGKNGEPTKRLLRFVGALALSLAVICVTYFVGQSVFSERLHEIATGKDASFFYRFTGPMLVTFDVFRHYPWAGAGLTGEPFIAKEVLSVYSNATAFQSAWQITRIADVLTNYFWLHWIYLGVVWGAVVAIGVSIWLRVIGATSLLYCWSIWIILGQASGAYVGPKTWAVLFMAAAASIICLRPGLPARQTTQAQYAVRLRPFAALRPAHLLYQ